MKPLIAPIILQLKTKKFTRKIKNLRKRLLPKAKRFNLKKKAFKLKKELDFVFSNKIKPKKIFNSSIFSPICKRIVPMKSKFFEWDPEISKKKIKKVFLVRKSNVSLNLGQVLPEKCEINSPIIKKSIFFPKLEKHFRFYLSNLKKKENYFEDPLLNNKNSRKNGNLIKFRKQIINLTTEVKNEILEEIVELKENKEILSKMKKFHEFLPVFSDLNSINKSNSKTNTTLSN